MPGHYNGFLTNHSKDQVSSWLSLAQFQARSQARFQAQFQGSIYRPHFLSPHPLYSFGKDNILLRTRITSHAHFAHNSHFKILILSNKVDFFFFSILKPTRNTLI